MCISSSFRFYPFCQEEQLKSPLITGNYFAIFQEPGATDIINRNMPVIKAYSYMVEQAF